MLEAISESARVKEPLSPRVPLITLKLRPLNRIKPNRLGKDTSRSFQTLLNKHTERSRESLKSSSGQKSFYIGNCLKIAPNRGSKTTQQALTYLKLRDIGCSKAESIMFSSKQKCNVDSTQVIDGPSSCRVLRRVDNSKEGIVVNGWQTHDPEFRIGTAYKVFNKNEEFDDYYLIYKQFEDLSKNLKFENGHMTQRYHYEMSRLRTANFNSSLRTKISLTISSPATETEGKNPKIHDSKESETTGRSKLNSKRSLLF